MVYFNVVWLVLAIQILDNFSAATGLHINYGKSTLVLMHTTDDLASQCAIMLGCPISSFPQTYLGLPLSCDKLRLSAFTPLISKSDKYLSGWQAMLLNPMGRAVLVNSVLDSQLSYAMATLLLPQGA